MMMMMMMMCDVILSVAEFAESLLKLSDIMSSWLPQSVRIFTCFYCTMHYNAKRGLAITCRLSVCPSVTLVDQDHIGWKSWKLIARTLSLTPSLFVAQRSPTYSQGNMGTFWGDEVGWEKVACWSTKAAISLKHVKIEEKLVEGPVGSHQ